MSCPHCYWDEAVVYCDVAEGANCKCAVCLEQRYLDDHPAYAAEQEYYEAEDAAQVAYEEEWDDWRELQAEATAAYRHWQRLLRRAGRDEASQPREAPERSSGEG